MLKGNLKISPIACRLILDSIVAVINILKRFESLTVRSVFFA